MLRPKDFYNKYKGKRITATGRTSKVLQWNSPYGGQCASLARQCLVQVWGWADKPYGNGKDFVKCGKKIKKSQLKDGDLIVWQNMTQWGHVAMYLNGKMVDQNPDPTKAHAIYSGTKIYIRPTDKRPKIKKWSKRKKFRATDDNLRCRLSPDTSTSVNIYKTVKKGKKISGAFYGEIVASGIKWYVYKNIKGQATYVAAKYLKEVK